MTNIPKHPCAGKCTEFKGEQCKTCLVQELPSHKSFDVDFLTGDVVVSLCDGITPELFEVRELPHMTYPEFIKCRPIPNGKYFCWLAVNEIRPATTAEIQANRRLTEVEQALAEVS
ncbi:hypothetical protein [Acinetobacter guillouiae]|uniref:hypothetical protein n=1 Tax=Acinetobacter guillouiae TaxID=106649 RepID=UPI002FD9FD4D